MLEFHQSHGKIPTITAGQLGNKFGVLDIGENQVINKFMEKGGKEEGGWINARFMIFGSEVFDMIEEFWFFKRCLKMMVCGPHFDLD